jgi:SAM-dependent methyltransferase
MRTQTPHKTLYLDLPEDCIPQDHARQTTARGMVEQLLARGVKPGVVLDLGCGAGNSVDFFGRRIPGVHWIGVDVEDSPQVRARTRTDADVRVFDGVRIPLDDESVDLVFCNQVLQYVRRPEALLSDVARVLRPAGHLVGSTSQLECYLEGTYWNFTPRGFNTLLDEAGLRLVQVRPSIDGMTLILRRLLWIRRIFDQYWDLESPLNRLIGIKGRLGRRSPRQVNARKLLSAGQFCFWAQRADAPADT